MMAILRVLVVIATILGLGSVTAAELRVEVSLDDLLICDDGFYLIVEDHDPVPLQRLMAEDGIIYVVYDVTLSFEFDECPRLDHRQPDCAECYGGFSSTESLNGIDFKYFCSKEAHNDAISESQPLLLNEVILQSQPTRLIASSDDPSFPFLVPYTTTTYYVKASGDTDGGGSVGGGATISSDDKVVSLEIEGDIRRDGSGLTSAGGQVKIIVIK